LMQYAAIQMHNGLITAADPVMATQEEMRDRATLNDLKDASPKIAAELDRRLKADNIPPSVTMRRFYAEAAPDIEAKWKDAAEQGQMFTAKLRKPKTSVDWKAPAGWTRDGGGGWKPPLPPGGSGAAGAPKDSGRFSRQLSNALKRHLAPETISDEALRAGPRFAEYNAATQQGKDAFVKKLDNDFKAWNKIPEKQRLRFFKNFETGDFSAMTPFEREQAELFKPLMDWAYDAEKRWGSKAEYRENYMAHMWENPKAVADWFEKQSYIPEGLGPKWFQEARTFDYIFQGIAAGFKLRTTNPAELVTKRLMASIDMQERMRLLHDLRDVYGLAAMTEGAPEDLQGTGWRPVNAPDKKQWLLHPDILPVWDNVIAQTGWWASQTGVGTAFRGWMALKNLWVPIKLSISGFHPIHVCGIAWASDVARAQQDAYAALNALRAGDAGKAAELAGMAGKDFLRSFSLRSSKEARAARQAWEVPANERTPDQNALVERMTEGGFVPQLTEELRLNAERAFDAALQDFKRDMMDPDNLWKLPYYGSKRLLELEPLRHFFFEKWIPAMKTTAYLLDDAAMAARHPEIYDDPVQRKAARRAVAEQNEDRFGEMFYKNLFWNKKLRDGLMAAYLSLGWQTGFIRQHLGAPVSIGLRVAEKMAGEEASETRKTIRAAENKVNFWPTYILGGMMMALLLQYFRTGETPPLDDLTSMDWQSPRIGGFNPDGTPRRVTTMWYNREYVAWVKHMEEMGGGIGGALSGTLGMNWNKMMLEPLYEIWTGEDYFRNEIRSPNAGFARKALQTAGAILGEQGKPISINNLIQAQRGSEHPTFDAALSLLGFGPAPPYTSRTATQNRIAYLYRKRNDGSRPLSDVEAADARRGAIADYLSAKANNDSEGMSRALAQVSQLSAQTGKAIKIPVLSSDITMFRRLPESDQLAILDDAPDQEARKYLPYANWHLYSSKEFLDRKSQIEHAPAQ